MDALIRMQNQKFKMFFRFTQNRLDKHFLMVLVLLDAIAIAGNLGVISVFPIYLCNLKCDLQNCYTLTKFKLSTIFLCIKFHTNAIKES